MIECCNCWAVLQQLSNVEVPWKNRAGSTLIVACVGVGNVGQLCVDVLISSLQCEFIGYLDSTSLPAVNGAAPYPDLGHLGPQIACSLEIYDDSSRKISLLQVRAPTFPGARNHFASELRNFISLQGFSRVILLTSSFSMTRKDNQLCAPSIQFATTSAANPNDTRTLATLGLSELLEEIIDDNQIEKDFNLPGSGFAIPLFKCLSDCSCILLNTFTVDGDNSGDAIFMANVLRSWLQLFPAGNVNATWKTPASWNLLFGNDADPILY